MPPSCERIVTKVEMKVTLRPTLAVPNGHHGEKSWVLTRGPALRRGLQEAGFKAFDPFSIGAFIVFFMFQT